MHSHIMVNEWAALMDGIPSWCDEGEAQGSGTRQLCENSKHKKVGKVCFRGKSLSLLMLNFYYNWLMKGKVDPWE